MSCPLRIKLARGGHTLLQHTRQLNAHYMVSASSKYYSGCTD